MHIDRHELDRIIIGSETSRFAEPLAACERSLHETFAGAKVLILGGGGSIGSAFCGKLSAFPLKSLTLLDKNENALAETIRDLRAGPRAPVAGDVSVVCADINDSDVRDFIVNAGFSHVFNFSALKHVRSEDAILSIRYMLKTNVVSLFSIIHALFEIAPPVQLFSISTDKAAAPVNVMGATKRLSEYLLGELSEMTSGTFLSSTRFANVTFSNGSITESILNRILRREPFGIPRDIWRFFITEEEAAEICLLSLLAEMDGNITYPDHECLGKDASIERVCADILEYFGYEAAFVDVAETDPDAFLSSLAGGAYPVVLTGGDTAGEKRHETFTNEGEPVFDTGVKNLKKTPLPRNPKIRLAPLVERFDALKTKQDVLAFLGELLPEFDHLSSDKSLNQTI